MPRFSLAMVNAPLPTTSVLVPVDPVKVPAINLTVAVAWTWPKLQLTYIFDGALDTILFPCPQDKPQRRDQLWQTTCLEFFLGPVNGNAYWEFNFSPSGDWNCYRFDGYRQGMALEQKFQQPLFELAQTVTQGDRQSWPLEIDLSPLIPEENPWQLGVTAVVQTKDSQLSYWALTHGAEQADFHQRSHWLIPL